MIGQPDFKPFFHPIDPKYTTKFIYHHDHKIEGHLLSKEKIKISVTLIGLEPKKGLFLANFFQKNFCNSASH